MLLSSSFFTAYFYHLVSGIAIFLMKGLNLIDSIHMRDKRERWAH